MQNSTDLDFGNIKSYIKQVVFDNKFYAVCNEIKSLGKSLHISFQQFFFRFRLVPFDIFVIICRYFELFFGIGHCTVYTYSSLDR